MSYLPRHPPARGDIHDIDHNEVWDTFESDSNADVVEGAYTETRMSLLVLCDL
jgi:hypothetical protein